MNNASDDKKKLIKSVALMVATAMVLVAVTVAWFALGDHAGAGDVEAEVEKSDLTYTIYEAVDTNKNGILDPAESADANWTAVSGDSLQLLNAAPNQYHFYKIIVYSGERSSVDFKLKGVSVTPLNASAGTNDILERIHVRFEVKDDGGDPGFPTTGVDDIDTNLSALLGDPAPAEYTVYSIDLTNYHGRTFEIFYDVGLYSDTPVGHVTLGSLIEIDSLSFDAS